MLPTSPRLSETAYEILNLNPTGYSQLIVAGHPCHPQACAQLAATDPSHLLTGDIRDPDMASSVACGLWLWNDYLDEAHKLTQQIDTDTGSFWHAIVHRREGHFPNSRHWYAKAKNHPAMEAIANQASVLFNDLPADNRLIRLTLTGWNADYFLDLIQHQHPDDPFNPVLVILQKLEWRILIEYCASMA